MQLDHQSSAAAPALDAENENRMREPFAFCHTWRSWEAPGTHRVPIRGYRSPPLLHSDQKCTANSKVAETVPSGANEGFRDDLGRKNRKTTVYTTPDLGLWVFPDIRRSEDLSCTGFGWF